MSIRKFKFSCVVLLFWGLDSLAQSGADSFWKIRKEKLSNDSVSWARQNQSFSRRIIYNIDSLNKDSTFLNYIDTLFSANEKKLTKLIGCQFPDATQLLNNDVALSTIYNDFTILNFHSYDHDTLQLEDLAKLKKESCESMTIIAFFPDSKEDIQSLINKYKNEIMFIPDAEIYIRERSFNIGSSVIWVLNKEKIIKYVKTGSFKEKGRLYFELKNNMSSFLDTYR